MHKAPSQSAPPCQTGDGSAGPHASPGKESVTAHRDASPLCSEGREMGGCVHGGGLGTLPLHYRRTSGYFCLFLKNLLTSVLGRGRGKMRQRTAEMGLKLWARINFFSIVPLCYSFAEERKKANVCLLFACSRSCTCCEGEGLSSRACLCGAGWGYRGKEVCPGPLWSIPGQNCEQLFL